MLRMLDLFSGIGGFSLGCEATKGFQTIAFCEIDPFCQKVLKKHWPNVPIFNDITKLGEGELNGLGDIDVICGGFPCQDISCAGKGPVSMPREAASGGKCSGSFAWYDLDTCLWRTWQRCLTGGLMKYLGRWPKAGMMRNGRSYVLRTLARCISENGSMRWPTPTASSAGKSRFSLEKTANGELQMTLDRAVFLEEGLSTETCNGKLNPIFVEWLMGYPTNWTDLEHSETL